jgi:hypothetical protein
MLNGNMQKSLEDRALTIVRKALLDCTGKEQCIHFLTALREQATIYLNAQLDGVK